ncbi:MAG: bifunctional hydroxymethylpyrimidine kinase/phosphomethylpyrimidine kinase, partial [Ruminococcus sp.]|nr:bifunctional hydroxymethylpyrimidine kinase/phosphomethylpyrimidine kinase [Ruminococcus sp.]
SSLSSDIYTDIMKCLDGSGVLTVVDASKKLLLDVLEYHPFLIKPNNIELSEMFGADIDSIEDIERYAGKLKEMGAKNVLVSMAEDGALLIDENGMVHIAGVCKGEVINSVGAGDSMLAGFIAGADKGYEYALKLGTAAGGATAFSEGLATGERIMVLLEGLIN